MSSIKTNNKPESGEGKTGDIRNLWSLCKTSLKKTNTQLHPPSEHDQAWLEVSNTIEVTDTKKIAQVIRSHLQENLLEQTCEAPDQGRTVKACSKHPASNHWIKNGNYTSFSTYRFAIKASLNLLPTKTTQKRIRRNTGDTLCRQCHNQPETLAHILNHCPPYVGKMRTRHKNILKRLTKALPNDAGDVYTEQTVAGDTHNLKPDLVVLNNTTKSATVIDVAIPFDTDKAMEEARNEKLTKYAYLKPLLKEKGYKKLQ